MLPFTAEELAYECAQGNVSVRKHEVLPLNIYNYTNKVQYDRNWNAVTLNCRGLILDNDFNLVARPFSKFFNFTEQIPDPIIFGKPCVAADKMDGSLGILYPLPSGDYAVATRGSFTSDQALWATNWFRKTYPDYTQPSGVTTLVEIIYPDNRIVLDYQGYEGLVLLSAIDNETGADIEHWNIDWWTGDRAELFLDLTTADDAYHYANRNEFDDKEGLVLTWYKYQQPAYRLKIKNAEYVRLHGIIHNFSKKRVWESLRAGDNFMDALADVPDEFYQMVKEIVGDLQAKFDAIDYQAKVDFHSLRDVKSNRKAFALRALELQYPKLMFAMLDNKQHSDIIWKMLEPKEETS